jgi:pantoate--beta-alanine ligase
VETFSDPRLLTEWTEDVRARGETIAFVPTMGFLHEGHLSLIREARQRADHLVVSIFVNPLQFAPGEDLERYPADLAGDAAKCAALGCDVLFTPTKAALYPDGFQTRVQVGDLAVRLCGASRAGHFEGVATVVLKLFGLVRPNVAVFGTKDFQQLQIIRRMVRDFDLSVDVVGMPIVREPDGLAMSSRNVYLTSVEREQALVLHRSLAAVQDWVDGGERDVEVLLAQAQSLVAEQSLADMDHLVNGPALAALAVRFGGTRLIDNRVITL